MLETAGLILIFAFAVIIHEVAHGLAAEKLGDPTARNLGRITLNPIPHIDLTMSIILPALLILSGSPFLIGGAKPVPVNWYNFARPRQDMALVALAGPVSNFIQAVFFWLLLLIVPKSEFLINLLTKGIIVNVLLGTFNMLPILPLDGGRIVLGLLPSNLAIHFAKLERFGLMLVILFVVFGGFSKIFSPLFKFLIQLIELSISS
jgi:Zn-dependent protease